VKPFAARIVDWQHLHGRHSLPWQQTRDPYRIWLSEIMLQQTQVATVVGYYERFLARFPDVNCLAGAAEDEVLALWSGLGYYSRARNLHAAAQRIVAAHAGRFPPTAAGLMQLPGIGRSTATAVAALAYGERCAILDGNVKRVLARHAGIAGWPGDKHVENDLWQCAESRLPAKDIESYTQGMMDLGALVCTRTQPDCAHCPVAADCVAHTENCTHTLPTPRPKKVLPERQTQMLLLLDRGELLLEKRPARGIWGGLWSLPELDTAADCSLYCQQRWGYDVEAQHALPPLIHGFTHFRLTIQPMRLHLAPRTTTPPGHVWLPLEDVLDAALPAPVRKLLAPLAAT
jgi:A/G-specific adenine glycosylase